MALQPAHLAVGFKLLTDATISDVEGFAFGMVFGEPHPAGAFELAAYGQPHRAVNRARVGVPQR